MRSFLLFLSPLLVASGGAVAQPTIGSLVGKVDGDPMLYECVDAGEPNKIKCDFVQVLLSNKESPEDLEEALKAIPEIVADKDGSIAQMCAGGLSDASTALAALERGETLPDGSEPPKNAEDLQTMRRFLEVLQNLCADRSAETAEAFLRLAHEQASKTCTAFINKYSQTFVKVNDELWVAESSPTGECGIVQMSRFVMPKEGSGLLWEYIAQKAITNKAGTTDMGVQCSGLNESETLYSWRGGSQRIDCVYID